jgi:hypothetical protein
MRRSIISAVDMIAAGFNVQTCSALRKKVRKVAEAAIDGAARLLRFPVERSLEAFVVSVSTPTVSNTADIFRLLESQVEAR